MIKIISLLLKVMKTSNKKTEIITKPNSSLKNKTGSWRTKKPETDLNLCISCGLCAKACPEGCIVMEEMKGYKKLKPKTNYDYCKGCGLCAHECPVKAIKMVKDY